MQGSSKDLYWFWRELYNKSLINGHIIIFYLLFSSVCANQSDYHYYYYANIPAYLANQNLLCLVHNVFSCLYETIHWIRFKKHQVPLEPGRGLGVIRKPFADPAVPIQLHIWLIIHWQILFHRLASLISQSMVNNEHIYVLHRPYYIHIM